jgi:hypothetical protein
VSDNWVDKVEPPDTVVEQGDCVRFVYGLSANCDIDEEERPEIPPDFEGDPPEEPEECCAPCTCPADVLSEYTIDNFYSGVEIYLESPCETILAFSGSREIRTKGPVVCTKTEPFCSWDGGSVNAESRTYTSSGWSDWQDGTINISINLDTSGSICLWRVSVSGFQTVRSAFKFTGDSPLGSYGRIRSCEDSGSSFTSEKTSATVS